MLIGIDIGGTKCAVVAATDEGKIIDKIKFPTEDVNTCIAKLTEAVHTLKGEEKIKAIGISCGGPLDSKKGIIQSPPNLPGWDDIHITQIFEKEFSAPAYLCNDANACALAEWKFGAGKQSENMVFLTFGTGLGAGLILNGKLYEGTNGMAGEVGHIRLSKSGPVGYGKQGSFEGFCSGGGIAQLGKAIAAEKLAKGEVVSFCDSADDIDKINAKIIADKANEGFEDAINVYNICAEKLGAGLSVIIDILNPEAIVIGSIYQRAENLLCEKMQEVIGREALLQSAKVCKILPAKLGDEIGDYAAISIAMANIEV